MGLSQSVPTPNTQEFPRVVVSVAAGAPLLALPPAVAPTEPDPFVPLVSTPLKLITVIEEATLVESVAVTVTPVSPEGAKARQISAVPLCTFVRTARTQVRPAPVTPFTTVLVPELGPSAEIR